jgi:hypothetical protein
MYKEKVHHMLMLIQGQKQPGNGIDIYLKLLVDELKTFIETWSKTT